MTNSESKFRKKEVILIVTLGLVAMTLIIVAVIPSLRSRIKEALLASDREVIAKVSGSLTPQGPKVTVLKIKSGAHLSLEIYSVDENQNLSLMTKIPLFESRDGHFLLQGNATNLALTDVDKDGNPEIVAPTYDEQIVPRLNIFKYNPQTQGFDRMTAPEDYKP